MAAHNKIVYIQHPLAHMEFIEQFVGEPLAPDAAVIKQDISRCDAPASRFTASVELVTALAAVVSDPHDGMERVGSDRMARLVLTKSPMPGFEDIDGETALVMASIGPPALRRVADAWYTDILNGVSHRVCLAALLRTRDVSRQFGRFLSFLPHFYFPGLADEDMERLGVLGGKARLDPGTALISDLVAAFKTRPALSRTPADTQTVSRFLASVDASPFTRIVDDSLASLFQYVYRTPSLLFQDEPGRTLKHWLGQSTPLPDSAVFAYYYAHIALFLAYGLSVGKGVGDAMVGPWPGALAYGEAQGDAYVFGSEAAPAVNVVFFATGAESVKVEAGSALVDTLAKSATGTNMIMLDPSVAFPDTPAHEFLEAVKRADTLTYKEVWVAMTRAFASYKKSDDGSVKVQRLPVAVGEVVSPFDAELVQASLLQKAKGGAKRGKMLFSSVSGTLKSAKQKLEISDHKRRVAALEKKSGPWVRRLLTSRNDGVPDTAYRNFLIELEKAKASDLFGRPFPPVPIFSGEARLTQRGAIVQLKEALGRNKIAIRRPGPSGIADFDSKRVNKLAALRAYVTLTAKSAVDPLDNASFTDTGNPNRKEGTVRFLVEFVQQRPTKPPTRLSPAQPSIPVRKQPLTKPLPPAPAKKVECVNFLKSLRRVPLYEIMKNTYPAGLPPAIVAKYGPEIYTSLLKIFSGYQQIEVAKVRNWGGQKSFLEDHVTLVVDQKKQMAKFVTKEEAGSGRFIVTGQLENMDFKVDLPKTIPTRESTPVSGEFHFKVAVEGMCMLKDVKNGMASTTRH